MLLNHIFKHQYYYVIKHFKLLYPLLVVTGETQTRQIGGREHWGEATRFVKWFNASIDAFCHKQFILWLIRYHHWLEMKNKVIAGGENVITIKKCQLTCDVTFTNNLICFQSSLVRLKGTKFLLNFKWTVSVMLPLYSQIVCDWQSNSESTWLLYWRTLVSHQLIRVKRFSNIVVHSSIVSVAWIAFKETLFT